MVHSIGNGVWFSEGCAGIQGFHPWLMTAAPPGLRRCRCQPCLTAQRADAREVLVAEAGFEHPQPGDFDITQGALSPQRATHSSASATYGANSSDKES